MKIGIVWNTISDEEYRLVEDVHNTQRPAWSEQFSNVVTIHLSTKTVRETFGSVFHAAEAQQLDYCVLSYGSAWAMNPHALKEFLEGDEVCQSAIAIRAGKIYAKAGVFSPKIPYVDSNFIIVNVQRCRELDIPKRIATIPFASHFSDAGGIHADLLSFLETIVPENALYVYDNGDMLQDMYGCVRARGFAPTAYLVDVDREFIVAELAYDHRVHVLRATLLSNYGYSDTVLLKRYIEMYINRREKMYMKGTIPFLSRPFVIRCGARFGSVLKNMMRMVNFEIQKKYDDDKKRS